jgi:hypothetical protein
MWENLKENWFCFGAEYPLIPDHLHYGSHKWTQDILLVAKPGTNQDVLLVAKPGTNQDILLVAKTGTTRTSSWWPNQVLTRTSSWWPNQVHRTNNDILLVAKPGTNYVRYPTGGQARIQDNLLVAKPCRY